MEVLHGHCKSIGHVCLCIFYMACLTGNTGRREARRKTDTRREVDGQKEGYAEVIPLSSVLKPPLTVML